jgi:hypothetical protein
MLRPCRNDDQITGLDLLLLASDLCETSSGREGQDLVDCMDLSKLQSACYAVF